MTAQEMANKEIQVAIADDHKFFRDGIKMALSGRDYIKVVWEAEDGEDLIEKVRIKQPDVLLLDLRMPKLDGFEATRLIRKEFKGIKIIVLTMYDDQEMITKMMEMGVNAYLTKTCEPDELYQAILTCMNDEFYFNDLVNKAVLQRLQHKKNVRQYYSAPVKFTEKELHILKCIAQEKTTAEISQELFLSPRTVEAIRQNIKQKVGAKTTAGIVIYALRNGLLEDDLQESNTKTEKYSGKLPQPSAPDNENLSKPDKITCTVFAPDRVLQGNALLVQVFAHTEAQTGLLALMAMQADEDAKKRVSAQLSRTIKTGTILTFNLSLPGLEVDEPVQSILWANEIASAQFGIPIPQDTPPKDIVGTVIVSESSIPIGHLRFKLKILPGNSQYISATKKPKPASMRRYKHAFVSYAQEDRTEVLKRVQMLSLVKLEFFLDRLTLEPGNYWENVIYKHIDESDVFFLFWSQAASRSEWVQKEIRYAIKHKQFDEEAPPEIIPVLIEGPPPAPPPSELSFLHFDDKIMYFINSQ